MNKPNNTVSAGADAAAFLERINGFVSEDGKPTYLWNHTVMYGDEASRDLASLRAKLAASDASRAELEKAVEIAVRHLDFTVSHMAQGHTVSMGSLQNCAAIGRAALASARKVEGREG